MERGNIRAQFGAETNGMKEIRSCWELKWCDGPWRECCCNVRLRGGNTLRCIHLREVVLRSPWKEPLPLFYRTLETFVFGLQHSSLRTDVRDFLIICSINAGCLGGRLRFMSRLLVRDSGMVKGGFWFRPPAAFSRALKGSTASPRLINHAPAAGAALWHRKKPSNVVKHHGHVSYDRRGVEENWRQHSSRRLARQPRVSERSPWGSGSTCKQRRSLDWERCVALWRSLASLIAVVISISG